MNDPIERIGLTTAILVQIAGVIAYFLIVGGWAWSASSGSIIATALTIFIVFLFTWPILAWGWTVVSAISGLLALGFYGLYILIRRCFTRPHSPA